MCTVSIIPIGESAPRPGDSRAGGAHRRVRLACNRDELRSRPAALWPVIRRFGPCSAVMPIDPVSDGAWIAVNELGIAATLLNVNLCRQTDDTGGLRTMSRGALVPRLMRCTTFAEAESEGARIDPRQYAPFRLVLVDDRYISRFYSDGDTLRLERTALSDKPHLFTSSGLGDALVEGPRRELFERMVTGADWESQQDAYHRHSWPDRRGMSVCMERQDARTVSHTVIEIQPDRVVLTYVPDAPDRARPLAPVALTRLRARE